MDTLSSSRRVRPAGVALSALWLVACGGGSGGAEAPASGDYLLTLTAAAPVAGVQWTADLPSTESTLAELRQRSSDTLGVTTQVLSRQAQLQGSRVGTQWLVFATDSTGQARWALLARRQVLASELPSAESVQCADTWGNPMACTLVWVPK